MNYSDSWVKDLYTLSARLVSRKMYYNAEYQKYFSHKDDFIQESVMWCLKHSDDILEADSWKAYATVRVKDSMHRTLQSIRQRGVVYVPEEKVLDVLDETDREDFDFDQIPGDILTPVESWALRQCVLGYTKAQIIRATGAERNWFYKKVIDVAFDALKGLDVPDRSVRMLDQSKKIRASLIKEDIQYTGDDMEPVIASRVRNYGAKFKGVSQLVNRKSGQILWRVRTRKRGEDTKCVALCHNEEDAATVYNFWIYHNIGPNAYMNTVPQPWLEGAR